MTVTSRSSSDTTTARHKKNRADSRKKVDSGGEGYDGDVDRSSSDTTAARHKKNRDSGGEGYDGDVDRSSSDTTTTRDKKNSFRLKLQTTSAEAEASVSGSKRLMDSLAVDKTVKEVFKNSIIEMIVENQIFEARDAEELLQCFLRVNSMCHHKVITRVFSEIWKDLFGEELRIVQIIEESMWDSENRYQR